MNVPDTVGVPTIEIVFAAQLADTPAGNPVAIPIPVAPVVEIVILVNAVLIHKVGVEDGVPHVLLGVTVIVPVAFTMLQPPVKGIE